jgi:molecular chaperone DnaK
MPRKILSLGTDGKLVLKLPNGQLAPVFQPEVQLQSAFLLIDCSSSMSGRKLTQAQEGAMRFAEDALAKSYRIGLIQFASHAKLLCEPQTHVPIIASKVGRLVSGGSTNMTEGLTIAVEELSSAGGYRAIVVVTDGMPDNQESALEVARGAKEIGIDIIAIGTDDADRDFLSKLASRSDLAIHVPSGLLAQSMASAAKLLPG